MLKELLLIAVVLLSIPCGYLLAWLCRDELISGRKWFTLIIISSLILSILSLIISNYAIALTLLSLAIATFISLKKSKDKSWTGKRIK